MSQTPDIRPEVNTNQQPQQQEKRRGGFWANLFSKSAGGGSSASGGLGSAAAGGLLATKAGIVGLAIIGTTVAGGIGYVGYKAMMPSSEPQTLSIFEARPKSALPADEAGQKGSRDGVSGSLDMFAKANTPDEDKGAESSASPAADPAVDSAAAGANKGVDHGNSTLSGPSASMPKPQFSGKIGGLSGSTGGSGSSAGYSAGSASGPQFGAIKKGSLSAGGKGANARPASVGAALKGLRRGSNMRTLGQIKKDQKGARSSQAAGRTYDGNSAAPGSFGAEGGVPEGGAGAGAADGGDLSGQPSTSINEKSEEDPPPPPPAKDVTPWAKELNTAKMLLMGATLLLLLASNIKLKTAGEPLKLVLSGLVKALIIIAMVLALAALVMGAMIAGGKFGQKAIGSIIAVTGVFLLATGGMMLKTEVPSDKEATLMGAGAFDKLLLVIGVGALVGVIATQFLKPKQISCKDCKGDKSCKGYCQVLIMPGGAPSDRAMKDFTV
ncbi:MAG: hypothetical protein WC943_11870 [Elusimicrobiota bacterium]|jgi:hypothetical protein